MITTHVRKINTKWPRDNAPRHWRFNAFLAARAAAFVSRFTWGVVVEKSAAEAMVVAMTYRPPDDE